MSLGAGLGGFVDGLETGIKLRERVDENNRKREDRDAVKQINDDTKSAFAEAQASGAVEEGDFEAFWTKYGLPKLKMHYLSTGDLDSAKKAVEWGESDAALKGGKLFASAMHKANTGNASGALEDAIKAGQTNGYIDHGYTLVGKDELQDKDGNLIGYRVTVKDADGKEQSQDIKPGDLPRFISNTLNPVLAGQSQIAAQQKAADDKSKRENDLALHEGKKAIDQKYDKQQTPEAKAKLYSDTRTNLMKNDPDFGDLSEEEKDKAVKNEIGRAASYGAEATGTTGINAAPKPQKMIVDTKSGKVVPEQTEKPKVAPDQKQSASPAAAPVQQQQTSTPGALPKLSSTDRAADASMQLKDGMNPEYVRLQLLNNGVPENEWPEDLKNKKFNVGIYGVGL